MTTAPARKGEATQRTDLVEMSWDPITRIVGSLGIYTKIDWAQKKVVECHSTSSVFRGYSIFMKGKDPRDAHFITSRICGICGDNHATCSVYNQNMAYGIAPPHLGEWIINLGEAAEYMFDHNIFQENLVGVDYCEKMVAETNPGVLDQANRTAAPNEEAHGYKTIGDIMRSLNPLSGEFYREALQVSRYTREMFCLMEGRHVHPSTLYPGGIGCVATHPLVTNDLVKINLGLRILLGSSYYEDWDGMETFVDRDPLGNPVDRRHPWNQHTIPRPQKRDFNGPYSWTMSPRWFDGKDHLALDTGGGPIARLWPTALAGLVNTPYVRSTGHSVQIDLPKTATKGPASFEWEIPEWSNALERNRARTYFQAYSAALALFFVEEALKELRAGHTKTWTPFKVPDEALSCGWTEAVRGVLSHHMVIRGGKIANYHPYPPTPWNGSVRDVYGTPGPYEDAVQNTPIFEENEPENFKGIDIMRAVRSFDPCLPCGVHMYLGGGSGHGKVVRRMHSPTVLPLER